LIEWKACFFPVPLRGLPSQVETLSLKRNIFTLQVLQASSYVIPLVIHPWMARALGPEAYGRFILVLAIATYANLFVDFGFSWTATRAVARCVGQSHPLSKIVVNTYAAKGVLIILVCVVLGGAGVIWSSNLIAWRLLLCALPGVFGAALLPAWYYQGSGRPGVVVACDLTMRTISAAVLVTRVRYPSDLGEAVVILALGQLAGGGLAFAVLVRSRSWDWVSTAWGEVWATLRQSFPLFISTSAVGLYTTTSSVLVGVWAAPTQLAYFGAAQRLVSVATSVIVPMNQALFPQINGALERKSSEALRLLKIALISECLVGVAAASVLYVFAPQLVHVLFGSAFSGAVAVVRAMAPLPLLLAIASICANLIIIPFGRDVIHVQMVAIAAAVNLALIFPLVKSMGARGAGFGVCIAEVVVMAFAAYHAQRLIRKFRRGLFR
jgi:O-antigen/teichoic acid export membrane protein